MNTPQDFYNKKNYLNKLLAARDFQLALNICKDYLQKEDHWFWHYAIASVYFELGTFDQSLEHFKIALNQIDKNIQIKEQIISKISELYLIEKKFNDNHQLLTQQLAQNVFYFKLAEKLYLSCSLQVNFSDFNQYIKNLETGDKAVTKPHNNNLKNKLKNFLSFLIQENEYELVTKISNYSFLNILYSDDEVCFVKGEANYLMANYKESKNFFLNIKDSKIKNLSFKFLAEIYRVEGNKFKSAKYSLAYLKLFPKDLSLVRSIAYNYTFKKKDHYFLKKCSNFLHDNKQDYNLNFAIGKIYDDLKLYDQSITYLRKANLTKNQEMSFNKNFISNEINYYKKCFNSEFYKKNRNQGFTKIAPIFIVGLPRSGSTLIEEILSKHLAVEALSEIKNFKSNFKYFFNIYDPKVFEKQVAQLNNKELYKIGEKYHNDIKSKLHNHTVVTDKMLFNFAYLPLLKSSFSNSKIIVTNRDYKDIFISIYKNYFSDPFFNFAYDEKNIVDLITIYHHTIKHWKKIMADDMLLVNYKDLVTDPETLFSKIFNFCELEWQSSFLQARKDRRVVDTASSAQVRREIYKDSLNSSDHYQKYFSAAFNALDQLIL
jgi:hypothetical protein